MQEEAVLESAARSLELGYGMYYQTRKLMSERELCMYGSVLGTDELCATERLNGGNWRDVSSTQRNDSFRILEQAIEIHVLRKRDCQYCQYLNSLSL